jgi:hypothetical protein
MVKTYVVKFNIKQQKRGGGFKYFFPPALYKEKKINRGPPWSTVVQPLSTVIHTVIQKGTVVHTVIQRGPRLDNGWTTVWTVLHLDKKYFLPPNSITIFYRSQTSSSFSLTYKIIKN